MLTKSGDARENLIRRFGPNEGLGVPVMVVEVVANRRLQFARAAMDSARQLPLGQGGKPALYQVGPGGTRRREMQVVARALGEPTLDERRLVSAVVIQNQMRVQVGRHGLVHRIQEFAEFDAAMPPMTFPGHPARFQIEGGK